MGWAFLLLAAACLFMNTLGITLGSAPALSYGQLFGMLSVASFLCTIAGKLKGR
jgi:hypothetical protein